MVSRKISNCNLTEREPKNVFIKDLPFPYLLLLLTAPSHHSIPSLFLLIHSALLRTSNSSTSVLNFTSFERTSK